MIVTAAGELWWKDDMWAHKIGNKADEISFEKLVIKDGPRDIQFASVHLDTRQRAGVYTRTHAYMHASMHECADSHVHASAGSYAVWYTHACMHAGICCVMQCK